MKEIKAIRGMLISHIRGEAAEMRRLRAITLDRTRPEFVRGSASYNLDIHRARRNMAISILADVPAVPALECSVTLTMDELLVVLQACVSDLHTERNISTEHHNEMQSVLYMLVKKFGKPETCNGLTTTQRLFGVLADWSAEMLAARKEGV